jgi:methionyl-tRNA synthetase
VTHFIGGDIIYHHCIFWPALLKGAGYGIPHSIVASGMVKVDDHKFSKSRGYVVWTNEDYLDKGLSPDYLRYYLLSYTNHTKELNFSWKVFQERVNNELVNTLGNFIYRTLYFAHKEYGGIPEGVADTRIADEINKCLAAVDSAIREYEFKNAVDAMLGLAAFGNNYIQTNAPWKLIKNDPGEARKVIRNCLQIVKALALVIEPVMPGKAGAIWAMLGYQDNLADHQVSESVIGLTAGKLEPPRPLFEKIDDTLLKELDSLLAMRVEAAGKPQEKIPEISIEDFSALDIRTGTIISAEPVPKSSKLLKLQVDIGTETRQIVSGISQFYKPEELIGKTVVVLANLKTAKIFGIESRGMVLAAGDRASLLKPETPVEKGTKIR